MKKFIKRIFGLAGISLIAVSLASCDESRNQSVPMDSTTIDFDATYASIESDYGTLSVTYEELYNKFRSSGYATVLKEIKKAVVAKEMAAATYEKNVELYNKDIISAIYGSNDLDTFKDATASEIEDLEDKVDDFISSEYSSYGYVFDDYAQTWKDLIVTLGTYDSLDVEMTWPDELIEQYNYSVALVNFAKSYLETIYDQEKIYSYEDEKMVTNSYYIDDDDIESSYKSTYYKYNKTDAFVIRFNSKAEADKYVTKVTASAGELTDSNAVEWYRQLYNLYHADKSPITAGDEFSDENEDETVFYYDADNTDLTTTYSSDLADFIYDHLEDKGYLSTPRNIDGSYYMIYRDSVTYYYGDGTGNDYDSVKDSTTDNLGNTIKNYNDEACTLSEYITYETIESKATESLGETLVSNRLKYNTTIEIYDPIYENQYYNTYEDYYDLTDNFQSYYIFSLSYTDDNFTPEDTSDDTTSETYTYTVDDFFEDMDTIYGVQYAYSLLESKYVASTELHYLLTDDEIDEFEDSAEEIISNFKKNKTSYSKKMGVNNYLVLTYGITIGKDAEAALEEYLYEQALITAYSTYYGYFISSTESTTGSTFTDDNNLFTNLKKFTDKTYDDYYDISVNHILISVDPVKSGTHENPSDYIEELEKLDSANGTTLADKFKEGVWVLTNLIYNELEAITATSTDAMSFIAKSFNNTAYSYTLQANDYGYTTWDDFKEAYSEFNYYLTAEDLGEITSSSSSSYVDEFQDYLTALADKIIASSDIQDEIEDNSAYLVEESSYDDLCLTEYGYHILNVYDYEENPSCLFTEDDDTSGGSTSSYKKYQHQAVVISEMDSDNTKDDLIVYATGYSDTAYASAEQLFIYFYQSTSDDGVEAMKSALTSAVKTYFSSVMSRYTSSSFQSYRLLQQVMGFENYDADNKTFTSITFYDKNSNVDTDKATQFQKYVKKLRIACDSDEELEEDDLFYGWFEIDWTSDLTKCEYYHYES